MSELFYGRRRKVGLLTTTLACLAVGGWGRGFAIQDSIWFGFGIEEKTHLLGGRMVVYGRTQDTLSSSANDGIVWARENSDGRLAWIPGWKTYSAQNNDFYSPFEQPGGLPLNQELKDYHWQLFGLEIAKYHVGKTYHPSETYAFWRIPYWSFTIPLTAVSLWILLLTPQKSNSKKFQAPCLSLKKTILHRRR